MSKSMRELKAELEEDCRPSISQETRDLYFRAKGSYDDDCTIMRWYGLLLTTKLPVTTVSTGGPTDFYDIGSCKDVDDLVEHWDLGFDGGNCLKALVGIAKGSRHLGTSPMRDANKLLHYAKRIVARLEKEQK